MKWGETCIVKFYKILEKKVRLHQFTNYKNSFLNKKLYVIKNCVFSDLFFQNIGNNGIPVKTDQLCIAANSWGFFLTTKI